MKVWKVLLIGLLTAGPAVSWASAQRAAQPIVLNSPLRDFSRDFSRGFNMATIEPVESLRNIRSSDIGLLIPVNELKPESDGSTIALQILDHSVSNFFKSMQKSDLGRSVKLVEKSVETEISLGGAEPDSTRHSIKVAMRAAQSKAFIRYSGVTNATVSYRILQSALDLEIREPLPIFKTDLVYNHIATRDDTRDLLSLSWAW
jgi:hypothetical protein